VGAGEDHSMTERGSDKHGPRLDDALSHEVEGLLRGTGPTHAEEWNDPEPSGEDQPLVRVVEGREGGAPDGMTEEDLELRAELAGRLGRAAFPADAAGLRAHLAAENAPDRLRDLLEALPADTDYHSVGEVWSALGLPHDEHRF
jgi:hypothetical protein